MFWRRKCAACAAKDQTILVLSDQVDWLRLHAGTPLLTKRAGSAQSPLDDVTFQVDRSRYMSDEEEDLRDMHESGLIGDVELERALAQVQALDNIEIHND